MLQVPTAESRTVVHIQFAGQPPFEQGAFQAIQITGQVFGQIKLAMGDQPGMVIDDGNQV
jgi:hypothetical protein